MTKRRAAPRPPHLLGLDWGRLKETMRLAGFDAPVLGKVDRIRFIQTHPRPSRSPGCQADPLAQRPDLFPSRVGASGIAPLPAWPKSPFVTSEAMNAAYRARMQASQTAPPTPYDRGHGPQCPWCSMARRRDRS